MSHFSKEPSLLLWAMELVLSWYSLQYLVYWDTYHTNRFCLLSQFLVFQRKAIVLVIKWIIHHKPTFSFFIEVTCTFTKQRGRNENLHLCSMFRYVNLLNYYRLENELHFQNGLCSRMWIYHQLR